MIENDLLFRPPRFGTLIKAARMRLGFSLRDLAAMSQVSPSQIVRLESGEFDCTALTMGRLFGALALHPQKAMGYCVEVCINPYLMATKKDQDLARFPEYQKT